MEKNRSRRTRLEIILALLCFGGLSAAGHYLFVSKKSEAEVSVIKTVESASPVATDIPVAQEPESPVNFAAREPVRDLAHEAVVSEIKVEAPPAQQIEPERVLAQSSAQKPVAPPQESAPVVMKSSVETPVIIPEATPEPPPEPTPKVTPETTPAATPVVSPAVTPTTTRKTLDPEFWVWAGVGENYQYYKQSVPSNAGSADFQNIKGPTLYLSVGSQGENFGAEFVHKESPGKMSAPPGTTITNGDYTWKTLSAETFYKPDDSNWRWRLGFQSHSMPFMVYTPSANRLDIKTNLLILATVGFDRIYPISKKLRGEWQLRYQHPISTGASSGDRFEVSPVVALDGSVGSIYQVTDQFRLGMFWYGQYHQYRFQYSGTSNFSGEQTLFYSNVELRAGFEF